eukprot:15460312-Alexandrium_andersonii.AAC.1
MCIRDSGSFLQTLHGRFGRPCASADGRPHTAPGPVAGRRFRCMRGCGLRTSAGCASALPLPSAGSPAHSPPHRLAATGMAQRQDQDSYPPDEQLGATDPPEGDQEHPWLPA